MAAELPETTKQAAIGVSAGDFTRNNIVQYGDAKPYIWQEFLLRVWFGDKINRPTSVEAMKNAINNQPMRDLFGNDTINEYLKLLESDNVWVILPGASGKGILILAPLYPGIVKLESKRQYAYGFVRRLPMPQSIVFSRSMMHVIKSITIAMQEDIMQNGDDVANEIYNVGAYETLETLLATQHTLTPGFPLISNPAACAEEWFTSVFKYAQEGARVGSVNYVTSDIEESLRSDESVLECVWNNMANTIPLSELRKWLRALQTSTSGVAFAPDEFMSSKKRVRASEPTQPSATATTTAATAAAAASSSSSSLPTAMAIPMSGPSTLPMVAAIAGGSGLPVFPTIAQTSSPTLTKQTIIVNRSGAMPPQPFPTFEKIMRGTVGHSLVEFAAQKEDDPTKLNGWFRAPLLNSGSMLQTDAFPFVDKIVNFQFPDGTVVGPSIKPRLTKSDEWDGEIKMSTNITSSPWTTASIVYHADPKLQEKQKTGTVQFPLSSALSSYLGELLEGEFHGKGRLTGVIKWDGNDSSSVFVLQGDFNRGVPVGMCNMSFDVSGDNEPIVWTTKWIYPEVMSDEYFVSANELGLVQSKGYLRIPKGVLLSSLPFVSTSEYENNVEPFDRIITVVYKFRDTATSTPDMLVTSMREEINLSQQFHNKLLQGNGFWFGGSKTWSINSPRFHHLANSYSQDERTYLCQKGGVLLADLPKASIDALKRLFANQLPTSIGYGADCYQGAGTYNELVLVTAYVIVYPERMHEYMSAERSFTSKEHIKDRALEVMRKQREKYGSDPRQYYKIKVNNKTSTGFQQFKASEPDFLLKTPLVANDQPPLQIEKNEVELFHGTPSLYSAANIIASGFEPPNRSGRFGRGVYFADSITKSDQYATHDKLQNSGELNKSLDVHEALLKLIDIQKHISQDELNQQAHRNEYGGVERTRDAPQLYVMLLVRVRMGTSLQLFEEEFMRNRHMTTEVLSNGTTREKELPFAVKPKLPSDTRPELMFDYVDENDMRNMTELHPFYDSLTIRGWSRASSSQADVPNVHDSKRPSAYNASTLGKYEGTPANALRFLEVVLYGKNAQNAIPVALLVYHRKYNNKKPYVKQEYNPTTGYASPFRYNPTRESWEYDDNPTNDPYNFDRFEPPPS